MRAGIHPRSHVAVVVTALALVVSAACGDTGTGRGSSTTAPSGASTSASSGVVAVGTGPTVPRYVADFDPRLAVTTDQPLFLYNVYVGDDPDVVDTIVDLWPEDLLPYLGIQVVFPSKPAMAEGDRAAALDELLDRTDAAQVPVIVQTAAFTGMTGPSPEEMTAAFEAHDSLSGIGIAELSADYQTSVGGLTEAQKELIASQLRVATINRGIFLWADMGYFGPQVFVDAGADRELFDLFSQQADRIVLQAKQNGAGRHFGTASAAVGLWEAGMARSWGINSEDWIWWESSFERLFDPQIPGGLTAAGMTRSASPNRSRLTYPESLFGIEMLMAAASGASLYSIEAPARGTIDAAHGVVSPAGQQVVFPLLRELVTRGLIAPVEQVMDLTPTAVWPPARDTEALATDRVFDVLGGPDGCDEADRVVCTQRQWLWRGPGSGVIPGTVPVLSDSDRRMRWERVTRVDDAGSVEAVAAAAAGAPAVGSGTAWIGRSARPDVWFAANPEENADVVATFEVARTSGDLGPHTFAVVEDGAAAREVLVDNFRTDTTDLWASAVPDEELSGLRLDTVPVAAAETTVLRFADVPAGVEPVVEGGESHVTERDGSTVTVRLVHRGPVRVTVPV